MKLLSQFTPTYLKNGRLPSRARLGRIRYMIKIGSIIILVAICLSTPAMADSKYPALRDRVDIVGIIEHSEGGEGLAELVVLVDGLMEKMK